MADELTSKVINVRDDYQLQLGGDVRETTVVRFVIGKFGPFEHVFDRNPSSIDIDTVIRQRRESLERLP